MGKIRPARQGDLGSMMRLLLRVHEQEPTRSVRVNMRKMRRVIQQMIFSSSLYFAWVSETQRAGLFGMTQELWYSDEHYATDLFFISRDGTGPQLLRRFVDWARARGCAEVTVATETGLELARTTKFFNRMGFTTAGGVYIKVLRR